MAVTLSILNSPPQNREYSVPSLSRRQVMRLGLNGCGCGCNECGESSINGWFSDAMSDAGNFHLELLDGIQRQWTGVDLIKTSFTADWIKPIADGITKYSHIAGALVITFYCPWLMPILIGGGMMIGTAIQAYDTRYLEYLERMKRIPTYDLSESEDKQLLMLCYWAVITLLSFPQGSQTTIDKVLHYYQLLKDKSKPYTVTQMFREMIDYGNNQMFPSTNMALTVTNGNRAYNTNATYHDAVDAITRMYDMIFCNQSKNYQDGIFRLAFWLISGQITIDGIWDRFVTSFNRNYSVNKYKCDRLGLQSRIAEGNPYKNFTNLQVTETASNTSFSPVNLSPIDSSTSINPIGTTGSTSATGTTSTTAGSTGNNNLPFTNGTSAIPTEQTAGIGGWTIIGALGLAALATQITKTKRTKRK